MSNYVDLTADNLLEITDQLDDQTLLTYCQTNKEIAALCDHKVWLHRIFKHNLTPLFPQAVLYPSLKEFYLNIRKDALYELTIYYVQQGEEQRLHGYYTNVKDVYDAIVVPREITFMDLELVINNTQYGINYRNTYSTDSALISKPSFVSSFDDILNFPNLEARPIFILNNKIPFYITSNNLRKIHKANELRRKRVPDSRPNERWVNQNIEIAIRDTGSEQIINENFTDFTYGFYSRQSFFRDEFIILLDQSLVDNFNHVDSSDNNYYVVITPQPPTEFANQVYLGLGFTARSVKDEVDQSSIALKYLEDYGTYYKLEDLPTLLRLYK